MQDIAPIIAFTGLLVFLAHLFTTIFDRTRIPDVLFLAAIGIILGPVSGLVSLSHFGDVGPVFTTVTLIIILFQCGTALKMNTLRSTLGRATGLALFSFFLTMAITTGIGIWLMKLGLIPALILGAIVGSTSESIVIPLARQLNIREDSQAVLSLESSINDVLSIVITVTLVTAYGVGKFSIASIASTLISSFVVAIVIGIIGALIWSTLHDRVRAIKDSMLTTPAFVFIVFGVVEMLGFNGAIAALAFGVTIGNMGSFRFDFFRNLVANQTVGLTQTERDLFSEIAFLLKTFFFVYLGISLQLTSLMAFVLGAILTIVALILRIPAVKVSLDKSTPTRDASIIAIMIPKGLAAVALASIPFNKGINGGEDIMNVTYAVVLLSMVMTSLLVLSLDKTKLSHYYGWIFSPDRPKLLFRTSPLKNKTKIQ